MAHHIRAYLDPADAPTDAQTRFDAWQADHRTVTTGRYDDVPTRPDGTRVGYIELNAYFDVRDDPTAIISDFTDNHFPSVSWLVVQHRETAAEGDAERQDTAYYDADMTNGLRAPVTVSANQHTLEYGDVAAVVGGSEVSAAAGSLTIDPPADSPRADTLTIESDGSVVLHGDGATVATLETHPGKIVSVDAAEFTVPTSAWSTKVTRGTPPTYLSDPAEPMPDPLTNTEVVREHISPETADALRSARDNGDVQAQLDHILDVLDVIDLQ
jgi:hypothetical protein